MSATMGVKLDEEMRERLKSLGKIKQRSPHWLMKEAIREYVEKEEETEAHNREADEAWSEYKQTGKGVTNEQMLAWFDALETGKKTKCPSPKPL